MKISIRSSIVKILTEFLQQGYNREMRFFIGKMERTGFRPYISQNDLTSILDTVDLSSCRKESLIGKMKVCVEIGVVQGYYIILGTSEILNSHYQTVYTSKDGLYNVTVRENSIDISLINYPDSLQELFSPLKNIFSSIENSKPLLKQFPKSIDIYEYSTSAHVWKLFPFMNSDCILDDYKVTTMMRGERSLLYLRESGVSIYQQNNSFDLVNSVHEELYDTLIWGDWYEGKFYGYDILKYKGIDVKKKSLRKRLLCLEHISSLVSSCQLVSYYELNNVSQLLNEYNGLMFVPTKANFVNNKTYIYQSVEKVGICFSVNKNVDNYCLSTRNGEIFEGSIEYPFGRTIPLSWKDRLFIKDGGNFEFRWDNNNFVPFVHSDIIYSPVYTRLLWNYINNPLNMEALIRTFKKT